MPQGQRLGMVIRIVGPMVLVLTAACTFGCGTDEPKPLPPGAIKKTGPPLGGAAPASLGRRAAAQVTQKWSGSRWTGQPAPTMGK